MEYNIVQSNESLKANLKDELRDELVTRDFLQSEIKVVDADIKVLRAEMKVIDTKFNILIAMIILFGTVLNPNVLDFFRLLLKL